MNATRLMMGLALALAATTLVAAAPGAHALPVTCGYSVDPNSSIQADCQTAVIGDCIVVNLNGQYNECTWP